MRNLALWRNDNVNPWLGLVDFPRIFDDAFLTTPATSDKWFSPATEIEETDNAIVMSVDLPGVSRKEIQVEVRDGHLFVSGERKKETQRKGVSERTYGKFQRVWELPTGVDVAKISADYEDGVLKLSIPKAESAKPRQIKIGDPAAETKVAQ